ncbi:MAG: AAA family ATPase, partial [Clostridia bacterium]|nr:AAA family ATPase [Clostridia bacterium]
MLLSLHIENIAVIKSVDFDFSPGFMVLTGETGAGKSIVIDSINLLLGAKAERGLIRSGESCATVSGLFGDFSEAIEDKLLECGVRPDEDGTVLVSRTVTDDGKSRITINGRLVNMSVLKSVTPYLVSIHGQSDTVSLMDSKNHLAMLDVYANLEGLLAEYRISYSRLDKIRKEIAELSAKASESERLKEILEYQIKDIDSAELHDGEEEELVDLKV